MTIAEKNLAKEKIVNLLNNSDLGWHSWHWWECKDEWFNQFEPTEIDAIAEELAQEGIVEGCNYGYRRINKTVKEKILLKFFG